MPTRSAQPFFIGLAFFVVGFGMVFSWWWVASAGFLGVLACLLYGMFDYDLHEEMSVEAIRRTEAALWKAGA